MTEFNELMKAAVHIKSTHLNQDKKKFESLPSFYKTGLYLSEMTKNIRNQKFKLQKFSFELFKKQGIDLVKKGNFDDANYAFCKSLCIFKYITTKNENWKNEGIKDEDLEYFDLEYSFKEEEEKYENINEEIKKMKISSLLNISLCNLNLKKFNECRQASEEVIKLEPKTIKA